MSDFDISYNLNYGSMARGKQQVDLWVRPSLLHTRIRLQFLSTKKDYIWKLKYYFNFLTSNDKRAEDSGLEKS